MRRASPLALLALLWAGCAPADGPSDPAADPQDELPAPPPSTLHPTGDGEVTRLTPRPDDTLPDDVLADRLDRATVAFTGEVVRVHHAEVVRPRLGRVPHTFVTWRVDRPVKGGVTGEQVTLRFLGGTYDDGVRSLEVSGMPELATTDRALVFVADPATAGDCPLVDCESGLLPLVGEQVTAPTGHLLVALEDGRTRFAEALSVPDPTDDPIDEVQRAVDEPFGTPLRPDELARRLHRPGPPAASLSVPVPTPSR